jgi:hypothetical protein
LILSPPSIIALEKSSWLSKTKSKKQIDNLTKIFTHFFQVPLLPTKVIIMKETRRWREILIDFTRRKINSIW